MLYHFHSQVIGRSGHRHATAAAAYRATEKIADRTTGLVHDYTRKAKALWSEIVVPDDAPDFCKTRAELWNCVQEKETRKNSQLCREYEVALQSELSLQDNIDVVRNFIKFNFKKNGLVADFSIHAPHKNRDGTDNQNLHAHILVTTRKVTKDGWGEKFRAENLEWIKEQAGAGKISGQAAEKMYLKRLREDWADCVNFRFQKLGLTERISEKTLKEQKIEREPQRHLGAVATAMERRGQEPEKRRFRVSAETLTASVEKIHRIDDDVAQTRKELGDVHVLLSELSEVDEKFEEAKQKILERSGGDKTKIRQKAKTYIGIIEREEMFWYVKTHAGAELDYWKGRYSKDILDDAFNRSVDEKIKTVRQIAEHPDFDTEIYPKVDAYYSQFFKISPDTKRRVGAFRQWLETTDFPPVRVCRMVVQKIRQWRDSVAPLRSQARPRQPRDWDRER